MAATANMKWFFCTNEASLKNGLSMLRKMLVSYARTNVQTLDPYLVYDGNKTPELEKLMNSYGVKIIYHRHRLADVLKRYAKKQKDGDWGYQVLSSTYLRTDIPYLCKQLGITDEFVLYTDWDILFLKNCAELTKLKPKLFCVAAQFDQTDYIDDINAGIMVMNLPAMYKEDQQFLKYIKKNYLTFVGMGDNDQSAIRTFFKSRFEKLEPEYNWKPYWGPNPDAKIVHFHVIKPHSARELIDGGGPEVLKQFYNKNPEGYKHYTELYENI